LSNTIDLSTLLFIILKYFPEQNTLSRCPIAESKFKTALLHQKVYSEIIAD
jgi:hypothetical protein